MGNVAQHMTDFGTRRLFIHTPPVARQLHTGGSVPSRSVPDTPSSGPYNGYSVSKPFQTTTPRSTIVNARPESKSAAYCVGSGHGGARQRFPNTVHNFCGAGTSDFDKRNQANTVGDYRPYVPYAPSLGGGAVQAGGFHDYAQGTYDVPPSHGAEQYMPGRH